MGPYLKRGRSTTLVRCPGRLGLSIVGSRTSLEKATHMPNHEFRRQSADRPAELWPSLNGRSSSPRGRTAPDRRVAAKTRCPHTIIPSYQGVRGDVRPGHNEDSRFQVYSVDRGGADKPRDFNNLMPRSSFQAWESWSPIEWGASSLFLTRSSASTSSASSTRLSRRYVVVSVGLSSDAEGSFTKGR